MFLGKTPNLSAMLRTALTKIRRTDDEQTRLRTLSLASADWFVELDADLRVVFVSEAPPGTTEYPFAAECPVGLRIDEAASCGDGPRANWSACLARLSRGQPVRAFRYSVANPLLGLRHYELNGAPHTNTAGRLLGVRLAVSDVSAATEATTRRDEMARVLTALFEHSPALITVKDVEGRYTALNRAARVMFDIAPDVDVAHADALTLKPGLAERITEEDGRVMDSEEPMTFEHDIGEDGERRTFQTTRFPILDEDGCLQGVGAISLDISDRRKAELEIQRRANFDTLTELPNRHLFQDRLTQALANAKRTGQVMAVAHVNLDSFRAINDVHGESIGDQILIETAWRIKSCLRDTDTVARLTADEFGIILTNFERVADVAKVMGKIADSIAAPLPIDGQTWHLTAGIGCNSWPDCGGTGDDLMRHADIALHRAKRNGPGRIVHYSADIGEALRQHQAIAQALPTAVARDEMFVVYQPLVDAVTHEVVAAEALVRWQSPEMGLVRPDRFISISEESDVIIEIGTFVLTRACRDAARWNMGRPRPVSVSVNVSPKQVRRDDFVALVKGILTTSGLAPSLLKLELTESGLMDNIPQTQAIFNELRALGVKISLDDFGTGYSALGYLQKFAFDTLKLDRSFIRDIKDCSSETTVAESIITMAQRLGLSVVAEGVETGAQLSFLKDNGCDLIQGYLFSSPRPLDEFSAYIMQQDLAAAA